MCLHPLSAHFSDERDFLTTLLSPVGIGAAAAELRNDTDWMECTTGLQLRLLREFGCPPSLEEPALRSFRAGPFRHPELKPLAMYHRHQRSRQGNLMQGDAVPHPLTLLDQTHSQPVDLAALAGGARPVVILAGSWS